MISKRFIAAAALALMGSSAFADSIDFTGNGGTLKLFSTKTTDFGSSVGFTSAGGGITGTLTATNSSGGASNIGGLNLDGYGVWDGYSGTIEGDETLIITFDQVVDIGSIHLRQWEGPDDGIVATFFSAGGNSTVVHTSDDGGAFNTNEHITLNATGVSSIQVSGIYNGKILGIPKTQFYVAGLNNVELSQVPLPAAAWLFGSALLGLVGIGRRKQRS